MDAPLPDPRRTVADSAWVAGRPGLPAAAASWQRELGRVRDDLDHEATRLARPRLWVDTVATLASTGWRAAAQAAPDLPFALLGAASGRFGRAADARPDDALAGLLTAAAAAFGAPVGPRRAGLGSVRSAEQLVRAGGPAYVKLGQFIASADGLLPEEWVQAFGWCRDRVPPLPPGVALGVLERELGEDHGGLVDVEPEPFAAASIGQVHHARLGDGTPVVVKVRRPGLRKRFAADIEALAIVAAALHKWQPATRVANLPGFVALFARLSLQELDLRLEALNMVELGAAFHATDGQGCTIPRPIPGLVTERVLVMEAVPGVSASRAAAEFGADLDGEALLHLAVRGVLEGTLVHGLFHGDMHAGNVLVDGGDRFSLVDFGICGRLSARERSGLVRFLLAFATMDAAGQVEALDRFGALPDHADRDALAAALQVELDALPAGGVAFDALGTHLGSVLRLLAAQGFELPTELVLFFKNVLYLSALAANVAPEADLLALLGPTMAYFSDRYGDELVSMAATA